MVAGKDNAFTPLRIAHGRDGAAPNGVYTGQVVLGNTPKADKPAVNFEQAKDICELYGTYGNDENEYPWRVQVYRTRDGVVDAALFIEGKPFSWDSTDKIVTGVKATLESFLKTDSPTNISKDWAKSLLDLLKQRPN
jgi:hypothetical protein